MRQSLRSVLVVGVLVNLLSGCQELTGRTLGETIDDGTITAAVTSKLAHEKAANLLRIDVNTTQGTVYLNGVVENAEAKQRAAALAWEVKGVKEVVNNLKVQ